MEVFSFNRGSNLHSYLSTGHKKTIELLIEKGANVNAVENTWSMTPLNLLVARDEDRNQEYWTEDDTLSNSNFSFICFWLVNQMS